jgi:peroxiredoxin
VKRWTAICLLSCLAAMPVAAALKDGDEAPDFSLPASLAGKTFTYSLLAHLMKTGAIGRAYDLSVREAQAGKKDTRGVEINHGFVERTTFIVTPDGRSAAAIGGLAPMENVAMALEVVRHLNFR